MHRLVQAQPFHVRPLEHVGALHRHASAIVQREKLDELRLAGRLHALDDVPERDADPGDHHRPGLDAAHAVDALLERVWLDEVLERVLRRLGDHALDLDRPASCLEVLRVLRRFILAGAEFVEVVIGGDVLVQIGLFGRTELALFHRAGEFRARLRERVAGKRPDAGADERCGRRLDELPAAQVQALRGDLGRADIQRLLNEHEGIIGSDARGGTWRNAPGRDGECC